jgi:hypothetical protein
MAGMSEEEPETKDWLGKNVEDGVADNLGVNTDVPEPSAIPQMLDDEVSKRKADDCAFQSYIGYMVQRTRVNPAIAGRSCRSWSLWPWPWHVREPRADR